MQRFALDSVSVGVGEGAQRVMNVYSLEIHSIRQVLPGGLVLFARGLEADAPLRDTAPLVAKVIRDLRTIFCQNLLYFIITTTFYASICLGHGHGLEGHDILF